MANILKLKPQIIIGEDYEGTVKIEALAGFLSGNYPYEIKKYNLTGDIDIRIKGFEVDYVRVSSQSQINSIKYLLENGHLVIQSLLNGLFDELENYKEIYGNLMPEIKSPNDFKDNMWSPFLHILDMDRDNYAYIGFEFACTWNEEHGVGVMMHKDRIVAIGQVDTAFNYSFRIIAHINNSEEENSIFKSEQNSSKEQTQSLSISKKKKTWWKFWE